MLVSQDFEALDDDILFILHKITVSDGVYETLIVLTRLLNNHEDKKIRDKYKLIDTNHGPYFPIESTRTQDNEDNPVFQTIIEIAKKSKAKPFK